MESTSDKLQMAVHFVKECCPHSFRKKKTRDFKNFQTNAKDFSPLRGTGFEPHLSTGIYFMLEVDHLLKFSFFAFGLISF